MSKGPACPGCRKPRARVAGYYLQGERNDRLFRVAAGKRGAGAPFEEIQRELHSLNLDRMHSAFGR
jgi:hypothetical protein